MFPLAFSPGPGNAFLAAIGASKGLRTTVPSLAGHHVATLVVTAAIGFGTGVAVLRDPLFAKALSVVGGFYVL